MSAKPPTSIPMDQIQLEKPYRTKSYDKALTDNIQHVGLKEPLRVEVVASGQFYILIHGYRRFESLRRLATELLTVPRTARERAEIILDLHQHGLDTASIAAHLCLSVQTIEHYIKAEDVVREHKEQRENRVSLSALMTLSEACQKHLDQPMGEWLIARFKNDAFNGEKVKEIRTMISKDLFKRLPRHEQQKLLERLILRKRDNTLHIYELLYESSLHHEHAPASLVYAIEEVMRCLDKAERLLLRNVLEFMSNQERQAVYNKALRISSLVRPPQHWGDFPTDHAPDEHPPSDFQ